MGRVDDMGLVRTVDTFATQPPVVCYHLPRPVDLSAALRDELIAAGLPERTEISTCNDELRVTILDDEATDRSAVVAKTVKAHKPKAG